MDLALILVGSPELGALGIRGIWVVVLSEVFAGGMGCLLGVEMEVGVEVFLGFIVVGVAAMTGAVVVG